MSTMLCSKNPSEGIIVTFSYGKELLVGETITSCAVVATVYGGVDTVPQAIVYHPADLSTAGAALQQIRGGVDGTTYKLVATALLSSGRTLVRVGILPVVEE